MNSPIILLNGWPGVGKDTVAETLKLLVGDDKANLMDWTRAEGESFQTVPGDDVVAQKAQRDACFADQIEHPSTLNKIVICTDCISDTPEGRRVAQDFEVVANRSNRLLIPVYLDCHEEENMRRISNSERRVSLKDKSKWLYIFLLSLASRLHRQLIHFIHGNRPPPPQRLPNSKAAWIMCGIYPF